jgi:hexosaminidase
MKKQFLVILFAIVVSVCKSQQAINKQIALIPQPASLSQGSGVFLLPAELIIIVPQNDELKKIASGLAKQLAIASKKLTIQEGNTPSPNTIFLSLSNDSNIPKEGYSLKVTTTGVTLTAREPAGIFYGVQTLLQLLPKQIETKEPL